MQEANEATVLGRFDGVEFTQDGVTTTFSRRDGKFLIRTDGPDGRPAEFEVKYTFGLTPLQQYLVELPGGKLQAFAIAWDSRPEAAGGQRWYHLYPDEKLAPGDPLHWTGIDQNWNYQCAWCHSTNLSKGYDRATRTFDTRWSEISVGCEACHGPASNHLTWASMASGPQREGNLTKGFELQFDDRSGLDWPARTDGLPRPSRPVSGEKELRVCAGCHARREQFSDRPSSVWSLFDAFRVSRLEAPLYFADGQQRGEVFNHATFQQSRMHAAGVTCSNCHDPHSGKLKRSGNAVCTQCHASETVDVPAHHHHVVGTPGAQCASCHMPTTVYMGVDARHDHSIRVPRPDRTRMLGVPNACTMCHTDKSAQWAEDIMRAWYPSPKPGAQTYAEAFDLGDRGAPGAQAALIKVMQDATLPGLVRASAVARLARYPSPNVLRAIASALRYDDPDIRSTAVAAMSSVEPVARRLALTPLLKDDTRLVRMDAARALAGDAENGLTGEDKSRFETALAEYVAAQLFNAERPEPHASLGTLYARRGMVQAARAAYEEAISIDPTFVAAAVSLAELERTHVDERTAEAILRKALERNPRSAELRLALGLSLVRQRRNEEAIGMFAEAAELAPREARYAYVHAVAVYGARRPNEAIAILKAALIHHPYDRAILMALISYEEGSRDVRSALDRAQLLARLEPERAEIQQLVERLAQQVRQ
jgi:predicted CXXCH cytochrome family protein